MPKYEAPSKIENQEEPSEKLEGYDESESFDSGEYPIESVFVHNERRTVGEVVKRINENRFILQPDFQRDFIWPPEKQSRLIESCLMRIPLPVFYLAEHKDGRIVVVDGLQRLSTFVRYMKNEFALKKLGGKVAESTEKKPLLGKKYQDLSLKLRERIEDTQLILYILDVKAPDRAKLDIFERVNSGGEPLTRQQMRNCLYDGAGTKWLRNAAKEDIFVKATGRSLNVKTMRDREAINRFCAFRILNIEKDYKSDMDNFLAQALKKMNNKEEMEEKDLNLLLEKFKFSMKTIFDLFGKHAFRKSLASSEKDPRRSIMNIALFDVCSVFFSKLDAPLNKEEKKRIREAMVELLGKEEFINSITGATNSWKNVRTRFGLMNKSFSKALW